MNIALVNYSGNVGKPTLAQYLLAPRIAGAAILSVETFNSDELSMSEAFSGKQFGLLQQALLLREQPTIVDVGSSNFEDFLALMRKSEGSVEDFDCFLVPVTPPLKQQRDAIATMEALAEAGVAPEAILLVFNMVPDDEEVSAVFAKFFAKHAANPNFTLTPDAVIFENEIFGLLRASSESMAEVLADASDFKRLIREAESLEEKTKWANRLAVQRLAKGTSRELEGVFDVLFAPQSQRQAS